MTDAEWAVIEPLLPAPSWMAGQGGCPGTYCRRDIIDGIRYLVHNGCVRRALPVDLPRWRTELRHVTPAVDVDGLDTALPGWTFECSLPDQRQGHDTLSRLHDGDAGSTLMPCACLSRPEDLRGAALTSRHRAGRHQTAPQRCRSVRPISSGRC